MNSVHKPDCFVCQKHQGLIPSPGGPVYQDDLIYISHANLWGDETDHYLGHVFIEPKRHVPGLSGLTPEEAAAIGQFTTRIARALEETLRVEHVYAFVLGDHVPHVHVHLIGRYPGAPPEYRGPRVDEWPEAPRGKEAEIADVVSRIRDFLNRGD
jgi:histidine triad (HIT) family protein